MFIIRYRTENFGNTFSYHCIDYKTIPFFLIFKNIFFLSSKMKRKLIIVNENELDEFTVSECKCDFCQDIHRKVREWNTFKVKTRLQKRMKKVVKDIEDKN
jgi:hypothetical protein